MASQETTARMRSALLDQRKSVPERVKAAALLCESDDEASWSVLQEVAERQADDVNVLKAAGEGLARLYLRLGRLLDAPLANLNLEAYLAFDEYVTEQQKP